MKEGETAKGLNYEVEDMQAGSQTISLSLDVMSIMENVRENSGESPIRLNMKTSGFITG